MRWVWNPSRDLHEYERKGKPTFWSPGGGVAVGLTDPFTLEENRQTIVTYKPFQAFSKLGWTRAPVVTWSKYGNDSSNYWAWTTTVTIPLPDDILPKEGYLDLTVSVMLISDSTWALGTYSKPEGRKVDFKGFTKLAHQLWTDPKKVGSQWFSELFVAGQAAITAEYPIPHITLSFNTECSGGVYNAWIDWDTIVNVIVAAAGTKLTLRTIQ